MHQIILLFQLIIVTTTAQQNAVHHVPIVDDNYNRLLEHYLCNDTVSSTLSNTTLLLSTTGAHALHRSCIIRDVSGLTIASNDSNSAVIYCNTSLGGAVFYNVTELAVNGIHIVNCSAPLPTDIAKHDNKSTFYFGPLQRSTLYFSNCKSISIESMLFESVSGFSMLVVNSFSEIHINNVTIIGSNTGKFCDRNVSYTCAGSGMVFYYHNHVMLHTSHTIPTATIVISSCNFKGNINAYFPIADSRYGLCYTQHFDNNNRPLLTAASLSFLFTQNSSNISVSIHKGHFKLNSPLVILSIFNNVPGLANVLFQSIIMSRNIGVLTRSFTCSSAVHIAIDYKENITADKNLVVHDRPIKFNHFSLKNQLGILPAIYITASSNFAITTDLIFEHLQCKQVRTSTINEGLCITAESLLPSNTTAQVPVSKLHLYFNSVKVIDTVDGAIFDMNSMLSNYYYSHATLHFVNIDCVVIEGSKIDPSMFSQNRATAITTYNSNLILKGYIIFNNNHGVQGGALSLHNSYLLLTEGVNATFTNNTANIDGGAIFAYNDPSGYSDIPCAMQFKTNVTDPTEMFSITI